MIGSSRIFPESDRCHINNIVICILIIAGFLWCGSVLAGSSGVFKGGNTKMDWEEKSSDHFIIHYLTQDKFAKEILDKAEVYYDHIAEGLGYPRYSDFWTWRCSCLSLKLIYS